MSHGWIKLEKNCPLPQDGECVIIGSSFTGEVGEARYRRDKSLVYFVDPRDMTLFVDPTPTHWMPLPIPPTNE